MHYLPFTLILLALSLVASSPAWADWQAETPLLRSGQDTDYHDQPRLEPHAMARGSGIALQNPGVEVLDSEGRPVGWTRFGNPEIREEDGNRYVRASSRNTYRQTVALPFRHRPLTVTGRFRTELGREGPALQFILQGSGPDVYGTERLPTIPPDEWTRLYQSFRALPMATQIEIIPGSRISSWWLDWDDIAFFDESLADVQFVGGSVDGREWQLADGASLGGGELVLPPGASASQIATAFGESRRYVVAITALAPGQITVTHEWLNNGGIAQGEEASALDFTAAGETLFATATTPASARVARVRVENTGTASVTLASAHRGMARVEPGIWERFPGGAWPELELTALAPDGVQQGSVEILDSLGATVATLPLVQTSGTLRATWPGDAAPAGDYTALFTLRGPAGNAEAMVEIPFELRTTMTSATPPPLAFGRIGRAGWIWTHLDGSTDEGLRPGLENLLLDGFEFTHVSGLTAQWPTIVSIAEEIGLGIFPLDRDLSAIITDSDAHFPFDEARYFDAFEETFGSLIASEAIKGYYVFDEPETPGPIEKSRRVSEIIATRTDQPYSIITYAGLVPPLDVIAEINSSAVWTDPYPHRIENIHDPLTGFEVLIDHLELVVPFVESLGREHWLILQTFTSIESYRFGPPELNNARIGVALALGSKGYSTFLHRQVTTLDGIRGADNTERPDTNQWPVINARVQRGEVELWELSGHTRVPSANPALLATEAEAPGGTRAVYVVNMDGWRPMEVSLTFNQESFAATELTDEGDLAVSDSAASVVIGPGDWRVWNIGNAELVSVSATSAPRPNAQPLDLPLLQSFDTSGNRLFALRGEHGSNRFAFSTNNGVWISTSPGTETQVSTVGGVTDLEFADDVLLGGDPVYGVRAWRLAGATPIELPGLLRVSGGARSILPRGDRVFLAMENFGMRELSVSSSDVMTSENVIIFGGQVREVVGPLADDSVLAVSIVNGLARFASVEENVIPTLALSRTQNYNARVSPDGTRVAIARARAGVTIARFGGGGALQVDSEFEMPFGHAELVAWGNDDVLFAADATGSVHAWRVGGTSIPGFLGTWFPPDSEGGIAVLEMVGDDRLFVGDWGGRVHVLDAGEFLDSITSADGAWMMLE